MPKFKVQMKSKTQMTKKNEEKWNDGTLGYWADKKSLGFSHYSIIPVFHYSGIIL